MTLTEFRDDLGNRWMGGVLDRFSDRARGWIFRTPAPGAMEALLVARCNAIHFCFVTHPLVVAFVDDGGEVLFLTYRDPFGRPAAHPRASAVFEVPLAFVPDGWRPRRIQWRPV